MKYRRDFVTNSSSASFLIARKPELSKKQIKALASYIEDELLGKALLMPGASEEELNKAAKYEYWKEDRISEVRKALGEGKTIYSGYVSYDEAEWDLASLYEGVWRVLADAADDDHAITIIDGDLSY